MKKEYSPYVNDEVEKVMIDSYEYELRELTGADYVDMTQRIGILDENKNLVPNEEEIIPFCIAKCILKYPFKTIGGADWGNATHDDKINTVRKLKPNIYVELTNKIMSKIKIDKVKRLKKKSQDFSGQGGRKTPKSKK